MTATELELKEIRDADALHKELWSPMYKPVSEGTLTMM
jgi:hypothetical protein